MTTKANDTCSTVSGVYRCIKKVDKEGKHEGACEAQAREYATTSPFVARNGFWFDTCATCKIVTKHRASGCETCKPAPKAAAPIAACAGLSV